MVEGSKGDRSLEAGIGAELVMDSQNVALYKGETGLKLVDLGVKEVLVLIHEWIDFIYVNLDDQILFFMKNKVIYFL